jgi:hypothetical protein|tara:strand:- start:99 stop:725 length:627 start_codon:yes stop_codon:yes gene_type:complete
MYARINLIKIKDDKKEQAMSMMTEEIIPSYEGTEGLLSMGAVMCDDTTGLNMSIWTDKASSDATESNLQSNIEKGAEILDGAPEIYRGDLALGAIYEDRPAGSGEGDYARVVFAKVESEEAVTNFLKEKIFPIYKEAEGIYVAGFVMDGDTAISWNFWESEEAANKVIPKFEEALSSAEGVFVDEPTPYTGSFYAGKNWIDFPKGMQG